MKRKINEKGTYPKVCVDCEVVLNPGVNCYYSMYSRKSYKCKVCKKKQSEKEHVKGWALPSYRAKKVHILKNIIKEPAGVYAIYENDDIVYIGQSKNLNKEYLVILANILIIIQINFLIKCQ